ncbi:unnamed protein product [Schistosoma rodhaini]|uniref:Phospholipid/glycerol acyltransferase domain-containing protein n=1 Tax=Schistosoma rodhaini TaxID=6188 RepID=A0AA85EIK3_9TREM|nr:unnamed protein product [Schistosoma rodhaini]
MGFCTKQECSDSQSLRKKDSLTSDNIEHEGDIFTPFTYQCRISKLQYIKMYLLTVTIFPFRVLMVGLIFLLSLFISNIFTTGYSSKSHVKPICDFRRWLILPIVRMSARFAFFLGGFHWIKVQGVRASRKEAPIMVIAPHSSFLDALIVVYLGMPSVVGKTESAESFVGGFFRLLQPILVNREDPNSRKKTIQELVRRAKSEEDWPQIVIFPEGTCTNRSCIATFKPGAFNAGVPVQPVIVRWPNKVDCVTWVCEGPGVLKLMWLLMSQFNNRLEIEFLPVYQPNEDEQLDAQLYANNIRRIMAEHLNVPLCDLSYDDFCQIRIAFKHKIPGYEAVVYLNSLLQIMFALERNCDLITDEDKQTEWFQIRLESMLGVCRSKPYLSRLEFIQTLFQTSQPNSKANYLINLVAKYYSDPSSNNLNFRMCMVHASMLLFPKLPHQAFYYATKTIYTKQQYKSYLIYTSSTVIIFVYRLSAMAQNQQFSNIVPMDIEENSNGKDVFLEKCILFAETTSTDRALGMMYLQKYNWDLELAVNKYFLTQQNNSTSKKQKRKRTYEQSNEQPIVIDLTNSDDSCYNTLADQTVSTTGTESIESLPILNVLSWNIQGLESANLNKRMMSVVETIKKEEFHVVCLQEVILVCLEILREKLESTYHIFSASDHNSLWDYFVVILVKKHPDIKVDTDSVSIQPFPNSVMNRHLLSIDLNLSQFLPKSNLELNLRIFTAHLESCAEYSGERVTQLKSVWDTMSSYVNCGDSKASSNRGRASIFCGDLNLRDSEVRVLGGLPYGIHDVWNECGCHTEIRNTWDPLRNLNARRQFRGIPQAHMTFRYDRMYVLGSRIKPVDFGLRGIEKVKNLSCLPSDHWAILGRFLLTGL